MNMKEHILSALREQIERWEQLLASMSDEQISAPLLPSEWCTKDVIAHLWAWQERSIVRIQAGLDAREPVFPEWLPGVDPDEARSTERTNAFLYEFNRERPWSQVHQDWRARYLHIVKLSAGLSERDLLDESRYAWMEGYPLVFVLIATYDHHQEHYDKLLTWLDEHGIMPPAVNSPPLGPAELRSAATSHP